MRDLPGYVETRHQLLTLKSSNRNNWISFAVAHHINGNHEMAVQVREGLGREVGEAKVRLQVREGRGGWRRGVQVRAGLEA